MKNDLSLSEESLFLLEQGANLATPRHWNHWQRRKAKGHPQDSPDWYRSLDYARRVYDALASLSNSG
jgi:hypothetical protein